jgi:hypothetical protein
MLNIKKYLVSPLIKELTSIQKEAWEQGVQEPLEEVGDCDPYSTSFRGREEGSFPLPPALFPPASCSVGQGIYQY